MPKGYRASVKLRRWRNDAVDSRSPLIPFFLRFQMMAPAILEVCMRLNFSCLVGSHGRVLCELQLVLAEMKQTQFTVHRVQRTEVSQSFRRSLGLGTFSMREGDSTVMSRQGAMKSRTLFTFSKLSTFIKNHRFSGNVKNNFTKFMQEILVFQTSMICILPRIRATFFCVHLDTTVRKTCTEHNFLAASEHGSSRAFVSDVAQLYKEISKQAREKGLDFANMGQQVDDITRELTKQKTLG